MALDICSDCGEEFDESELDADFSCPDCAGNAETCDSCGCWFRTEDLTEERGLKLCMTCYN